MATKKSPTQKKFDFRTIETVQDAFKKLNMDPSEVPDLSRIPERFREPLMGAYNLMVGFDAINDGWRADYTKRNQKKWYAWPWVNSAGSGFFFPLSFYYCGRAHSGVGSRLCTDTRDKIVHLFEKFNKEFIKFLLK